MTSIIGAVAALGVLAGCSAGARSATSIDGSADQMSGSDTGDSSRQDSPGEARPCPPSQPSTGATCGVGSAMRGVGDCGYATTSNPCGAVNCYCLDDGWECYPTCVIVDSGSNTGE